MENQPENQPKKLNILLVDNPCISVSVFYQSLNRLGHNVKRVVDDREAVSYCRDNPDVDLVLMVDIMHVMFDNAALEIRKFNKELVIIAIAPVGVFSRKELMDYGCTDFIENPFTLEQLTSILKKYQPL